VKYFFVTGFGRSGSKFLATLLNLAPEAKVEHEPFADDYRYLPIAYYGGARKALGTYLRSRRQLIESGLSKDVQLYGETNSLLRYFIDDLPVVFDNPEVFLLIRNGRDVVRSCFVRSVYTPKSLHAHVLPKDDDPWADEWSRFSRFEQLCWLWQATNNHVGDRIERVLRFEDILSDFDYLSSNLLHPLGLSLSRESYRSAVENPVNTTEQYVGGERRRWFGLKKHTPMPVKERPVGLPPWDDQMERRFCEICGDTMQRFGYS
jgi:hypothetical protein